MIRLLSLLSLVMMLFMTQAFADRYHLDGRFAQGGLIFGQTEAGTLVTLEGQEIPVNAEGQFLLGFGRDAALRSHLMLTYRDGGQDRREIVIEDREFTIQRIDGLPKNKVSPNPILVKRIQADNAQVWSTRTKRSDLTRFESGFQWPVKGRVSSVFGSQRILNGKPRSMHKGVDIAAATGTLIEAAADGVISLVSADMYLMGQTVMIDHGMGLQSIYIHMSDILVSHGQIVQKGDPIGKVGATGRATGPHLHWGVSLGTTALDPELLVGPHK